MGSTWGTGRVEAFSDGVLAIAITLLVLEIHVPASELDHPWRAIADQWPSYLAYATSFLTIGGIWLSHHGIFERLEHANARVMRLNLLLLMTAAFLPYPTRLMAESLHDTSAARAAVIFYGGTLLMISFLFAALWGSIARDRHLLRAGVSDEELNAALLAAAPRIGFYTVATGVAIVAPRVAAFGYLVIAVLSVMLARGEDTRPAPPQLM